MLSSPWYPEENYDEVPIDKEFMDISERSYNEHVNPSSSLISTNLDSHNKYEHPSIKGNDYVPPTLYSDRRKFYQRDEDTFENGEPTKFDPYLSSKTSTGSSKQEGILNQYSFMLRPKSDNYGRSFNRNSYHQLPRKFSEFDDQRIRNLENEKVYNKIIDRSNRLNNGIYMNKKVPSFFKENDKEDYYKPLRKFTVIYRADQDPKMFEQNDDKYDLTDLFKESKIPETYEESSDESIVNFDSNSYLTRNPSYSSSSSRDKIIYNNNNNNNNNWFNKLSPNDYYITRNYYNNMGKKSDVPKIIDRDRLLSDRKEIVSFRQLDHDKSSESVIIGNDKDYKMKISAKNGGHILGQHDIINNEEEKLHTMQETPVKIFNVDDDDDDDDSSIKEENSFKFDPDFLDDIEYPSAEFTEPAPTNESTESPMMTEN
ncbi:hypothetical protein M0804_011988 [Polistes exclamans]|nr:hypothetical protein M0804_011988 [Polistes exclamans]